MHQAGAAALTKLLQYEPPDADHRLIRCPRAHSAGYKELRSQSILTVRGTVKLKRPYFLCSPCSKGQYPVDAELGVADLEVPAQAIERAAQAIGAPNARRDNQEIARAKQLVLPVVSRQDIPRMYVLMDGVQGPVVGKDTEGRQGKTEGQRARTRECKRGCVFTPTAVDEKGWAIRDPDSTSYVGAIETAGEFGLRIYPEAWRRGWKWAKTRVVIADGAIWIGNLADLHFPGTIQIVDLYHAREHLWETAALLFPNDAAAKKLWVAPLKDLLDGGEIEAWVGRLREIASEPVLAQPALAEEIVKQAEYFATNASRMRYPTFRAQGLFVGSGVVEAGCKTVIGSRLKRSAMFWTVRGANDIIALRCSRFNGRGGLD